MQSGFNLAKWLHSGKSDCFRAKTDVFGQSGFNLAKRLYSGKSDSIWAKVDVLGQ